MSLELAEFLRSKVKSCSTEGAVLTRVANVVILTGAEEVVVFDVLGGMCAGVILMVLGGEEDGLVDSMVVVVLGGPVVVFFGDRERIVLLRETEALGGRFVVWSPESGGCAWTDLVTGGLLVFGGERSLDFLVPVADVKDILGAT